MRSAPPPESWLIQILDIVVVVLRIGTHVELDVHPLGVVAAVGVEHLERAGIVAVHIGDRPEYAEARIVLGRLGIQVARHAGIGAELGLHAVHLGPEEVAVVVPVPQVGHHACGIPDAVALIRQLDLLLGMLGLDVRREVTHVLDLLELRCACAEVEQDVIDGLFGRNDACVALPDRTAFDDELARIGRIAVGEVVPCGISRQLGENLELASAQRLEGLIAGTELRSGARDVGGGRNTLHAGNREFAAGGERRPRKQFALHGPVQVARAFGGNARGIGGRGRVFGFRPDTVGQHLGKGKCFSLGAEYF